MDNRIIPPAHNTALGAARVAPIGTLDIGPPLKMVVERHNVTRRGKYNTACDKILRWRPWKILRAWCAFRHRDVASRFHEFGELCVGDVGLVHIEAVYINAVNGT